MKKLLLIFILIFTVIFAGCSNSEDTTQKKVRSSVDDYSDTLEQIEEDMPEKTDDTEDKKEEKSVETSKLTVDESFIEDVGKTKEDIEEQRGQLSEFYWSDGPIYRFGDCVAWYGFEDYEQTDNSEFIPSGACNIVSVPFKMLVKDAKEYNAEAFEQISETPLEYSYTEMYGTNVYEVKYNGYRLLIYADSKADINKDSVVNIEKE